MQQNKLLETVSVLDSQIKTTERYYTSIDTMISKFRGTLEGIEGYEPNHITKIKGHDEDCFYDHTEAAKELVTEIQLHLGGTAIHDNTVNPMLAPNFSPAQSGLAPHNQLASSVLGAPVPFAPIGKITLAGL